MGVSAARKKPLWKWDDCRCDATCGARGWTRLAGRQNQGVAENSLQPDACRAGDHELTIGGPILADLVVGGILYQKAAEVGFRSEIAGRYPAINRVVAPLGRFEWI